MINKFNEIKPYSTTKYYEFLWVAEYLNGTLLSQYDIEQEKEVHFNKIDKTQLLRYGLVGNGNRMYYDVSTGMFNFAGRKIEFIYKVGDKEYPLTGGNILYNDPIYFQEAYTNFNMRTPIGSTIYGYNFGYKCQLSVNGVNFSFKPIFKVQLDKPVHMKLWLVADRDMDGCLIVRVNGLKEYKYEAPLKTNTGGELTWIVQ